MEVSGLVPQLVAAESAAFLAFSLGTALGWPSPVLPRLAGCSKDNSCALGKDFGGEVASWIGGIIMLGGLAACFVTGWLIGKVGPKRAMMVMAVPQLTGWVLLALVKPLGIKTEVWFYVARFLLGLGGGAYPLTVPFYVSETSQTSIRGALGSLMHFNVCLGILFVNGVGALVDWHILTMICCVFPVIAVANLHFKPDSPYYLICQDRESEARVALECLRGPGHDIDAEIRLLRERHEAESKIGGITLSSLVSQPVYYKPMAIMLALMFFQKYSGVDAFYQYLGNIFIKANTGLSSGLQATLVALVQVIVVAVSILIVEKLGRRPLLAISGVTMCLALSGLGAFFYLSEREQVICSGVDSTDPRLTGPDPRLTGADPRLTSTDPHSDCIPNENGYAPDFIASLSLLPLVSLTTYVIAFNIGFGAIPWMMCGEIFSVESKALSASLANISNWVFGFAVTKTEVNVQDVVGASGAYFLYAVICALASAFVLFLMPETRGRTPEEMKAYFQGKTAPGR